MIGPARIEGAEGHAISFDGEFLIAVVARAFAPGTPLKGSITLVAGEISIEGRATGSKRTAEGTYEVRARIINLRKSEREALVTASSST